MSPKEVERYHRKRQGYHEPEECGDDVDELLVPDGPYTECLERGLETMLEVISEEHERDEVERVKPGIGKWLKVLDKKEMQKKCKSLLGSLSIEIGSVKMRVDNLSGGQRQSVAIAKSLYSKPKLLIMDEPTTAISVNERKKVLGLMQDLSRQGISVIFISHTLQEIFSVAHRVVVLRKGIDVANKNIHETTIDEIIKFMVG